jgi:preprotein translocase subunit SecG
MHTVIVVIHLMVVAAMIGVVLLQKSEGGGLGIGSSGGFLSSRGTSNVLTRTTAILAGVFFTTSLILSILAGSDRKPKSIIQGAPTEQAPVTPAQAPGGNVLDTLRQSQQQPVTPPPAPPPGPQVPESR